MLESFQLIKKVCVEIIFLIFFILFSLIIDLPATINEQKWEKITVIPISNNQTVQSTKQQQKNTRNDEQWTSIATPTTQENQITTADITSTLFIQKSNLRFFFF
jgi:uncharacterized membrane protein (UPF0182 family)